MATDKNGRELKVGDKVWLEMYVKDVSPGCAFCQPITDIVSAGGYWLRSELLILRPLPPDDSPSTDKPAEVVKDSVGPGDWDPFDASWI